MYTILRNKTAVIDCDNLQTAIRFVQSLESGLDRLNSHSPYTIVKTDNLTSDTTTDMLACMQRRCQTS